MTCSPEARGIEALAEVSELAVAARAPPSKGDLALRAMNAVKGLRANISETNKAMEERSKLVGAVKRLRPLVAGFFPG
ncbi:MAG: hypothetical protein ACK6BG_06625 [Cyanobacteriota bacterium]